MKTTLTLITTFSILSFVSGQTFTNYTIDSGLVNNDVLCLDVAGSDVMWFGTQEGISVFNGTTWIAHTTATDTNLAHNTIQALCVLSDGNNMRKSVSPFLPDPLMSCIFSPNNCSENALASSRVADAAINCNLLLQIRFSLFMI